MKLTLLTLPAFLAALTFAACGTSTVSKEEVAKQAQTQFDRIARERGGEKFPKIVCPKDLEAKVGNKTRCSATGTDGTLGITVTVNTVDGDKANLNFKADDKVTK